MTTSQTWKQKKKKEKKKKKTLKSGSTLHVPMPFKCQFNYFIKKPDHKLTNKLLRVFCFVVIGCVFLYVFKKQTTTATTTKNTINRIHAAALLGVFLTLHGLHQWLVTLPCGYPVNHLPAFMALYEVSGPVFPIFSKDF